MRYRIFEKHWGPGSRWVTRFTHSIGAISPEQALRRVGVEVDDETFSPSRWYCADKEDGICYLAFVLAGRHRIRKMRSQHRTIRELI